jgi:hypothetical protein
MARAERADPDPVERLAWEEFRPRLDAEVARLPEEYRTAFILCHLEGKTNEEAARELGCPVGTVQSRLSRARARLRQRLRRQDLGPESIPFILFILRPQAPADLSPALVYRTVRSALEWFARPPAPVPPVRSASPPRRRWLRWVAVALLAAGSAGALLAYGSHWLPAGSSPWGESAPACTGGCHSTSCNSEPQP